MPQGNNFDPVNPNAGGDWFAQFSDGASPASDKKLATIMRSGASMGPAKTGGTSGGSDPNGFANFYDFWDAWDGLDLGAAAQAWTAAHPNDPATVIGHSGDGVRYQGADLDGITNVGSPNQAKARLFRPTPAGGGGNAGAYGGDSLIAPWTEQFQRRSPEEIAADPGFQFQMGQGTQTIERGAASHGTLLTGGTLKALDRFGQGLAHTYDQDAYNRDQNEYLLRRDNFFQNQDRPYTKLTGLAALGRPS
jgi:hypothetical protein